MSDDKKEDKKPAKETMIKCEVLRAIGVPATEEDMAREKMRAQQRGRPFIQEGLTTMLAPNKPIYEKNGKLVVEPEPVFVMLDKKTAKKLQLAGAVRVDI